MKVLIVSDTHRKNDNYLRVVQMHKPDAVIHCGDVEGSEYALTNAAECPVYMVSGNNDFFSELPRELEIKLGKHKLWITHGHRYFVSMSEQHLYEEAVSRGVDIVCYGHTHKPSVHGMGGIYLINPGSLSYPRQDGRQPSYVIMEEDRFGDIHFTIAYI